MNQKTLDLFIDYLTHNPMGGFLPIDTFGPIDKNKLKGIRGFELDIVPIWNKLTEAERKELVEKAEARI